MNEVRQEIKDIKKSQEAFQQVVTAALQTILSNWQQIQSNIIYIINHFHLNSFKIG